jgi:hypothetical protein
MIFPLFRPSGYSSDSKPVDLPDPEQPTSKVTTPVKT